MRPDQLAINSISTSCDDLEATLGDYAQAGFRNVECYLPHLHSYLASHNPDDLRRLFERMGLGCIGGFEATVTAFVPDEQLLEANQKIIDNCRLLGELGASCLVVGTDGPRDAMPAERSIAQLAGAFARLGEAIADTHVILCLEFNWSPLVKSLRTAADIARLSGADNIGVLFDPAHYHCTPTKFLELSAANVAMIRHVHVDDMNDKPGELCDCNADRALPGQGCLPLGDLFQRIEKHGYRGYFSIEMFDPQLRQMSVGKAAKLMYQSLTPLCDA